jgi:hypothetical protein
MGSTYYGSDPKDPTRGGAIDKLHVTEMLAAFPLETIAIGIGTMVPGGKCSTTPGLMTGEYGWTQNSLKVFLDWVGSKGITKLGIWRADIAALLYKQPHYCGVEPWMLAEFQAWASNKTVPLSLKTDDIRGSTAMKQQLRHAAAPLDRTVMAWMGWGGRTDAQIDDIVRYFIANRDAITTASPTSHSLGDNATLIERNLSKSSTRTRQDIFKQLRAGGVRVLPTIWNDAGGMKTSLLPKFLQLAAAPDNFIDQAVALAVVEDLDGWVSLSIASPSASQSDSCVCRISTLSLGLQTGISATVIPSGKTHVGVHAAKRSSRQVLCLQHSLRNLRQRCTKRARCSRWILEPTPTPNARLLAIGRQLSTTPMLQ